MKAFIYFLILLNASVFNCFSQGKKVVVDAKTKKGLPFAEISFDDHNGVFTNKGGVFTLPDYSITNLKVSSLGHEKKKIPISDFLEDTVYLKPKPLLLDEVMVFSKESEYKIGFAKKKKYNVDNWVIGESEEIITRLFPKSGVEGILKTIYFSFEKMDYNEEALKNSSSAMVRCHIYNNDSTLSGIYSSGLIEVAAYRKDKIALNILSEHIYLDQKGLAFGLEYIGHFDEEGEQLNPAQHLHPSLVNGKNDAYDQVTMARMFSDNKKIFIPSIEKHLQEYETTHGTSFYRKSKYDRNLAIAMTLLTTKNQ